MSNDEQYRKDDKIYPLTQPRGGGGPGNNNKKENNIINKKLIEDWEKSYF